MTLKNKELKKLFDVVELYYDMVSLPSVMTSFMACDDAIEDEIAALKAELTDANWYKDFYRDSANNFRSAIFERGDELRKANNQIDGLKNDLKMAEARIEAQKKTLDEERKHSEDLADVNGQLASENADLKTRLTLLETSRITWRSRAQHAEKEVEDLNKKISDLEKELAQARNSTELHLRQENDRLRVVIDGLEKEINDLEKKIQHLEIENANLRVTPADANAIEVLKRENRVLRCDNKKLAAACEENNHQRGVIDNLEKEINTLKKKIHDLEEENDSLTEDADALVEENADIHTRPWHGDGNAMTGARNYCESLSEIIEFQSKKIKELKAENEALKKEASKLRTRSEDDLSYGHEFEFGDEVFVPWSCNPYMYIKSGQLYNPRTERLVYVGKDQHLKWFGEKFAIV